MTVGTGYAGRDGRSPICAHLQLDKGEYITVNENIVIQAFPYGSRVTLRIDAPREVPIARGAVSEKAGQPRPEAITEAEARAYEPKAKSFSEQERSQRYFDKVHRWERRKSEAADAIKAMERMLSEIKSQEIRDQFMVQLERILPLTE